MDQTAAGADLQLIGVGSLQLDASISSLSLALLETLKRRCSERAFGPQPVPLAQLSRLLWAAFGCNRGAHGGRTAPSPFNLHFIDIYVVMADGAFRFDAEAMCLRRVADGDVRAQTSTSPDFSAAYATLVYVADPSQMEGVPAAQQAVLAALCAGHLSQNVYLFCAAEGLATSAHTSFDPARVAGALGLPAQRQVLLAQALGQPAVARPPAKAEFDM